MLEWKGLKFDRLLTSKDGYAKHQPWIISPQAAYIHTEVTLMENKKQDRQCTYNVTMRHIHATTVAVRKAKSITYSKSM